MDTPNKLHYISSSNRYIALQVETMGLKTTNHLKTLLIMTLVFCMILTSPRSSSTEYYADITIEVDASGFVTIEGETNYPELLAENTEVYTSKNQSLWLLNITKTEVFSNYIFDMRLPEEAAITNVQSSGSIIIGEEHGTLVVTGFGENNSFSVEVQYQIKKTTEATGLFGEDALTLILIVCIMILIGLFIIIVVAIDQPKKSIDETTTDEDLKLRGLNERQKQIITLLTKHNKPLTQTEIQHVLHIPKSSVSRNIHILELKGLIEKEQIGMSNRIRLKKP